MMLGATARGGRPRGKAQSPRKRVMNLVKQKLQPTPPPQLQDFWPGEAVQHTRITQAAVVVAAGASKFTIVIKLQDGQTLEVRASDVTKA